MHKIDMEEAALRRGLCTDPAECAEVHELALSARASELEDQEAER